MKEEELKLLENEFCLGCARSCDLLHPNCERGLVKMQEILEEYKKRDDSSLFKMQLISHMIMNQQQVLQVRYLRR